MRQIEITAFGLDETTRFTSSATGVPSTPVHTTSVQPGESVTVLEPVCAAGFVGAPVVGRPPTMMPNSVKCVVDEANDSEPSGFVVTVVGSASHAVPFQNATV